MSTDLSYGNSQLQIIPPKNYPHPVTPLTTLTFEELLRVVKRTLAFCKCNMLLVRFDIDPLHPEQGFLGESQAF